MAIAEHGSFKPNLAEDGVLGQIPYPQVLMPKYNGVRGGVHNGILLSRTLKQFDNIHTTFKFSHMSLSDVEGELVVGDPLHRDVFVRTTSGVGSIEGEPQVAMYAFDYYHPKFEFIDRLKVLQDVIVKASVPDVIQVGYTVIHSDEELEHHSQKALAMGFEGVVLRRPTGIYKQGRSTAISGDFLRYVPWLRSEAMIIDILEGSVNNNESVVNELGYKKKSSHKDNKVGSGAAGSFVMRDIHSWIVFKMPVATVAFQMEVWANPSAFIGTIRRYKFKLPVKAGGKPRFPQDEGPRLPQDM